MLVLLSVLACALYLVPLAALVAVSRRDSEDALDLAATMGVVFAGDLLGTMLLTRVLRLDAAAFVRTALIAAAVAAIAVRRARRGEAVVRMGGPLLRGDLVALGVGAAAAFALSLYVSSHYYIWDREWHVPFTAALRAQRMPFFNVYDPHAPLRYHLAGDVFAASLQSLSVAGMGASRSLSVAHDLQAAVAGGIAALLLRALCSWPPVVAGLTAMVPLLAGPMAFAASLPPYVGPFEGDSDFNNFTLSFRPHCMIAGAVLIAFLAHVARLVRERQAQRPIGWRWPALLTLLMGLLSITDEIAAVFVGLAFAVLWLLWPTLLGPRRFRGLVVLVSLAVAALAANLFLGGTIAPGGPIEKTAWLAPRLPRFATRGLPLGLNPKAWRLFFADEGSLVVPALAAIGLVAANRRVREALPFVLFALVPAAAGLFLFLCFEVNGRTFEGHRFMTAGRFLVPFAALACVARLPRRSPVSLVLLVPIAVGVVSTFGFIFVRLPNKGYTALDGQYETSCRDEFGARLGEPIVPTYVDKPIWYLYAGCHPIFAAGHDGPAGVVLAGPPKLGPAGFAKMDRETFPAGQPARVVCAKDPALTTPLCKKAETIGQCEDVGMRARSCSVPANLRHMLAVP